MKNVSVKRDVTEQIETQINNSAALNRSAKWLDNTLTRIFLNGPLQPVKNFLSGKWLEHPLHPVLTDLPVGAWFVAVVLDVVALVFGVPNLGFASGLTIGLGLLAAFATIITGLMDWQDVGARELTIGLTHALVNTVATIMFAISFFWRWASDWNITVGNAALIIVAYFILTFGAYLGGTLVFRLGTMVNRDAFVEEPSKFVNVMAARDLPENQPMRVEVKGTPVLLVKRGETIFAVGAVCSHLGGPLEEGKLVDGVIECPWHFSRFALQDGRVVGAPATSPLPWYETRVNDGQIQMRLKN